MSGHDVVSGKNVVSGKEEVAKILSVANNLEVGSHVPAGTKCHNGTCRIQNLKSDIPFLRSQKISQSLNWQGVVSSGCCVQCFRGNVTKYPTRTRVVGEASGSWLRTCRM